MTIKHVYILFFPMLLWISINGKLMEIGLKSRGQMTNQPGQDSIKEIKVCREVGEISAVYREVRGETTMSRLFLRTW